MIQQFIKIRYIFLLGVVFILLNSILFLVAAVIKSIQGYRLFLEKGFEDGSERPGVYLLESLDLLLVSIVFFILGFGILKIFILSDQADEKNPRWLQMKNFMDLKALLWETSLVTLMIFAFTRIVSSQEALTVQALILPGIIVLLALGLFIMKKANQH
jgi:uncharacterized membrane protein YqhA